MHLSIVISTSRQKCAQKYFYWYSNNISVGVWRRIKTLSKLGEEFLHLKGLNFNTTRKCMRIKSNHFHFQICIPDICSPLILNHCSPTVTQQKTVIYMTAAKERSHDWKRFIRRVTEVKETFERDARPLAWCVRTYRSCDQTASANAICPQLHREKCYSRALVHKPLITKENDHLGVQWCENPRHWSIEKWKTVIRSDESSFSIFSAVGGVHVCLTLREWNMPECLTRILKGSTFGSVML